MPSKAKIALQSTQRRRVVRVVVPPLTPRVQARKDWMAGAGGKVIAGTSMGLKFTTGGT